MQFAIIDHKTGLILYRRFQHLEAQRRGSGRQIHFVWSDCGRNKYQLVQRKCFVGIPGKDEVSVMNGIECPAVNTNFAQTDVAGFECLIIKKIRAQFPAKVFYVTTPLGYDAFGWDAPLDLRAYRSAAVDLKENIELVSAGAPEEIRPGRAVQLRQHVDTESS